MLKRIVCVIAVILGSGIMTAPSLVSAETVEGTVTYVGKVMKPQKLEITKDIDVCGKKAKYSERLIVNKNRGLKNAVISIIGTGKTPAPKNVQLKLDQHGCQFIPHMVIIPVGSTVDLLNRDGIMHNIHTYTVKNDAVNFSQPGTQKVKTLTPDFFTFPETIKVQCDVHNWMAAWMIVTGDPAVLSNDSGSFKLTDIPPGTYKIKVWHEFTGAVVRDITVKEGKNSVNFEVQKKKRRRRRR